MTSVLCFGDSNTWGTMPQNNHRYGIHQRWSALLNSALGDKVDVIEAGQPNRTVVNNAPFAGNKSGIRYLKPYLVSLSPSIVIIMLGTNDLKKRFALSPAEITQGIYTLVKQTLNFSCPLTNHSPKVLLVCPPPIYEVGSYVKIYADGEVKSQELALCYAQCADDLGCSFFDAGTVIQSCKNEGIHWQVEQHQRFANALVPIINAMFDNI